MLLIKKQFYYIDHQNFKQILQGEKSEGSCVSSDHQYCPSTKLNTNVHNYTKI